MVASLILLFACTAAAFQVAPQARPLPTSAAVTRLTGEPAMFFGKFGKDAKEAEKTAKSIQRSAGAKQAKAKKAAAAKKLASDKAVAAKKALKLKNDAKKAAAKAAAVKKQANLKQQKLKKQSASISARQKGKKTRGGLFDSLFNGDVE